jgi:hypothetical protein
MFNTALNQLDDFVLLWVGWEAAAAQEERRSGAVSWHVYGASASQRQHTKRFTADHKNVGENERNLGGRDWNMVKNWRKIVSWCYWFLRTLTDLTVGFLLHRSQLGMQKRAEECQLWAPSLWLWLFQRHQIQSLWRLWRFLCEVTSATYCD